MKKLKYKILRKGGDCMFKLINGTKENTANWPDICIVCDNVAHNDDCSNCDGYMDPCWRDDLG